eukprot:SM000424S15769  [mRNA]  locus=s424:28537:30548:+ [translate_table: standard]
MVWFQCEDCGAELKKPKLKAHFFQAHEKPEAAPGGAPSAALGKAAAAAEESPQAAETESRKKAKKGKQKKVQKREGEGRGELAEANGSGKTDEEVRSQQLEMTRVSPAKPAMPEASPEMAEEEGRRTKKKKKNGKMASKMRNEAGQQQQEEVEGEGAAVTSIATSHVAMEARAVPEAGAGRAAPLSVAGAGEREAKKGRKTAKPVAAAAPLVEVAARPERGTEGPPAVSRTQQKRKGLEGGVAALPLSAAEAPAGKKKRKVELAAAEDGLRSTQPAAAAGATCREGGAATSPANGHADITPSLHPPTSGGALGSSAVAESGAVGQRRKETKADKVRRLKAEKDAKREAMLAKARERKVLRKALRVARVHELKAEAAKAGSASPAEALKALQTRAEKRRLKMALKLAVAESVPAAQVGGLLARV